eukprot:UN01628
MSTKRKSKKKSDTYEDEEKKREVSSSPLKSERKSNEDNLKQRKFYVTKEIIEQLNNDKSLLTKLTENFKAIKADLQFENNQIVIRQVHLDNERVLKMVQDVIGLAYSEAEFNRLVQELASIEHPRKGLLADPAATFSNFVYKTEKGACFIKHNDHGAPRKQWFSIKGDRLYWRDKEKGRDHNNRSMEMKGIVKIKPGKTTKTFKKKKAYNISEDSCFSIIGVRKSLDLQCKSRLMRDEWFTYIEFTHRHYVPAKRRTMYLQDLDNPLDDDLDLID